MSLLSIPDTPKETLANKSFNTQESQIISEGQFTYFVNGEPVYPPEGGILVYKYGGVIKPLNIDPSKYEEAGNKCLTELKELLKKYDFDLIGQDRQPVMLMPNEVIRLENSQVIEDRVDLLYPEKGYPDPLAISLVNKVKRYLKEDMIFFSYKWTMIAFSVFLFLPFKIKIKIIEKWLDGWSGFGDFVTSPKRLKPRYYTEFSRETLNFTDKFLGHLGISKEIAYKTAWISAEMIERDNAYRWRAEDLATEVILENLIKNPQKEIDRIMKILKQRETKSQKLVKTAESFAKLLKIALYHPKIKKAFVRTLKEINFKNFQFDEIDKHQVMRYAGYDFWGLPQEARKLAWNNLYNGNPPKMVYVS